MENAVYTFEQLFSPSRQADSAKVATTIEKVKLRVLKVSVAAFVQEDLGFCLFRN